MQTGHHKKPPLRWLNVAVLGIPTLVSLIAVPWYGFTHGYDAYEWLWFLLLMTFCELSITAGYHRLWSHGAYKAHPVLRFIYALGGACALQSDCLTWASDHRRHHLYVDDTEKDPYCAKLGFWYSHFEWMIRDYPSTRADLTNVKDLLKDPILVWQRKHYLALLLVMNVGVPVLLGWWHGNIWGSFLLAGFLRLTLSQHFTYLINSAAHAWGKRTYDPQQTARDNWVIALLTFGEGYHNYHHTFAWDYRNGVRWYHYDPTKWLIKCCAWLRLARDLRSCSSYRIEMTRIAVQYQQALLRCEALQDEAGTWKEKLESEYAKLVAALNAWSDTRHAWLQAKSAALSQELQQELDALKARYKQLKQQLQCHQSEWRTLLEHLGGLHLARA
ncbi:MAG: fatty acid desaturase [Pseudomonadales bacterium]|jgi:stearoyl-CoA desaturase (delta-9 desaturase)|nr:fatty acid desaturase [Pseudomonadales bacterium]